MKKDQFYSILLFGCILLILLRLFLSRFDAKLTLCERGDGELSITMPLLDNYTAPLYCVYALVSV